MTDRQRILAVLRYEAYDRLPIVHFGFLDRTLQRWQAEGHLTDEELKAGLAGDATPGENAVATKLGFDCNYHTVFAPATRIQPAFESRVIEELPNGDRLVLNGHGAIIRTNDRNQSIPAEVDHILKSRKEWEEEFLPRLRYHDGRVNRARVNCGGELRRFDDGGREYLLRDDRASHILLHCGSLCGALRDYLGIQNLCFLSVDDELLLDEMIEVNADLCYRCAEAALASGVAWDIGHFWEDICYKNGPLVNPRLFAEKVGPHYRRITALLNRHGVDLVSLDSDGLIDELLPVWLDNGVNVMFPIEVGTWGASFAPWRAEYGRELRGVGGLDKRVFQRDYAAVDAEIERLRPIVELGGYLPCPDHRLPHDNKWENVQYYCERMREVFG